MGVIKFVKKMSEGEEVEHSAAAAIGEFSRETIEQSQNTPLVKLSKDVLTKQKDKPTGE